MTVLNNDVMKKPLLQAEEAQRSLKIPLLFRANISANGSSLSGIVLNASSEFPGTLTVVSVSDANLKTVEQGDRVTHVNGVMVGGDMESVSKALAGSKGQVVVQLMRKRNPYVKRPYHSLDGRAHSDDNSFARCEPSVDAEEEIHGKDLNLFPYVLYEVRSDDVLKNIADSFGIKVDDIRTDNRDKFEMGCPGHIYPGEVLRIRNKDFDRDEEINNSPHHWSIASPVVSPNKICVMGHTTRIRGTHEVQARETLEDIAALYEMTVCEVRSYNRKLFPSGMPGHVEPGMKLLVFRPAEKSVKELNNFAAWAPSGVGEIRCAASCS